MMDLSFILKLCNLQIKESTQRCREIQRKSGKFKVKLEGLRKYTSIQVPGGFYKFFEGSTRFKMFTQAHSEF